MSTPAFSLDIFIIMENNSLIYLEKIELSLLTVSRQPSSTIEGHLSTAIITASPWIQFGAFITLSREKWRTLAKSWTPKNVSLLWRPYASWPSIQLSSVRWRTSWGRFRRTNSLILWSWTKILWKSTRIKLSTSKWRKPGLKVNKSIVIKIKNMRMNDQLKNINIYIFWVNHSCWPFFHSYYFWKSLYLCQDFEVS